ncbi:MAG TPA: nucleotide exchange factor GrpE [Candidatus Fraserbacteria bacterium]|nr:nucleotide exchange factor GrpE [Candidatus Fraserbacteria bacterium]
MPEESTEQKTQRAGKVAPEEQAELEGLRTQLAEREQRLATYLDRLQHLQADFANYKKRVAREQQAYQQAVEDQLLRAILPIYDNFERAFRTLAKNNDKDSFIEGLEQVYSQFNAFLQQQEIRPLEVLGQPFDPAWHEALMSVETETEKANIIIEEFERGYRRGERLLRPSRVKVTRQPTPAEQRQGDSQGHPVAEEEQSDG